ncbi:MAG: AmmeMemoRadiSam system radical SAM enzyme [Planctomycetota bacterium]|nr:AmmeMemoRadiSam system radical SAM enzyme [Planctomycetota bacterium]
MRTLGEALDALTTEGELSRAEGEGGKVKCLACAHGCVLAEGKRGVCRMRFNAGGRLRVPWGYTTGIAADPVEKKPMFHVHPGSIALSFGMLGCNLQCDFCQNWVTSQVLRDPAAGAGIGKVSPEEIVAAAVESGAKLVVSTYNEPLITSEWAAAIFRKAKARGMATGYVSNGFASPEVLDYLRPCLDVFKVDLKTFRDGNYRRLGGRLQPVLDTLKGLKERGFWVEVVTLIVPGFNDSEAELSDIAGFLASLSPDIPWHVTAFFPTYRHTDAPPTPVEKLAGAVEIGRKAGLRYVYAGNVHGRARGLEDTLCPKCGAVVIERSGYRVGVSGRNGICAACGTRIAGIF